MKKKLSKANIISNPSLFEIKPPLEAFTRSVIGWEVSGDFY